MDLAVNLSPDRTMPETGRTHSSSFSLGFTCHQCVRFIVLRRHVLGIYYKPYKLGHKCVLHFAVSFWSAGLARNPTFAFLYVKSFDLFMTFARPFLACCTSVVFWSKREERAKENNEGNVYYGHINAYNALLRHNQ